MLTCTHQEDVRILSYLGFRPLNNITMIIQIMLHNVLGSMELDPEHSSGFSYMNLTDSEEEQFEASYFGALSMLLA